MSNYTQTPTLGLVGRLAAKFVLNKRLSLLFVLFLFLWGVGSYWLIPKQYNPQITAPAFQVQISYPGASSWEVYEEITSVYESQLTEIPGVETVRSQSRSGGVSIMAVQFTVGLDAQESKIKIRQLLSELDANKPNTASITQLTEISPDDVPVMSVAYYSDSLSLQELHEAVQTVADKLSQVSTITNVKIYGHNPQEVVIELDPEALQANQVTASQVIETLQKNNDKLLIGDITTQDQRQLLEVQGQITSLEELENLQVIALSNQPVAISQLALVKRQESPQTSLVTYRHKDFSPKHTIYLSLAKKAGTNSTEVTQKAQEIISQEIYPDALEWEIVRDEGQTASQEINGLMRNLFTAIFIVSLILWLFLGWRAAIIAMLAIPLTIASVFGWALIFGQTVNRITLFALILSLGLLVDNATVIVENSVRHLGLKKTKDKDNAIIRAVDEVGVSLILATLTTLLAFYPMEFVTGLMGPYMGPIPFFVPMALLMSLLIAFTINPFLGSLFLQASPLAEKKTVGGGGLWEEKVIQPYKKLMKKFISRKKWRYSLLSFTVLATLLVMLLPVFQLVQFRMLPKADKAQFFVYLDYPNNITLQNNIELTREIEDFLLQEEHIQSLQTFIATPPIVDFNGLFRGVESRQEVFTSTIKVNLTPPEKRSQTSEDIVLQLRADLQEKIQTLPVEVGTLLVEDPPGPPVMSTVLLKIKGQNYNGLQAIASQMRNTLTEIDEVVDIQKKQAPLDKEVIDIDLQKASQLGITSQEIIQTVYGFLSGIEVYRFKEPSDIEASRLMIRFINNQDKNPVTLEDLQALPLSEQNGQPITVGDVTRVKTTQAEPIINSEDGQLVEYVAAEMGDRSVTYAALDVFDRLYNYKLPFAQEETKRTSFNFWGASYQDKVSGDEYQVSWGGEWKITVEVFRDLGAAMMVGIFLIYMLLVAQFGSFRIPLMIMGTVPMALIGVLPGYWLLFMTNGLYFNATSMIGVIALAGIVVNNAIIMVEYFADLLKQDKKLEEVVIQGAATRMRPIILTSLTTILGSLTIVSDPVWAGLAWSIILGISTSTVLTLVVFPSLYYTFVRRDGINCDC